MIRISGNGLGYLATESEFRDYHLIVEFKWGRTNWAWGDRIGKARDSGIFLHSIGPDGNSHDGNGAFRAAIECQIMQGSVGDFLLIRGRAGDGLLIAPRLSVLASATRDAEGWPYWWQAGRPLMLERWGRVNWRGKATNWIDYIDFRGPQDVESPVGEWTRVECICAGDSISVTVNGKTVNEIREVFPKAGRILLQCEGSEIFFRRVELLPLPIAAAAPVP
jgi:3-keto-disaccharide hydrolase